MQNPRDDIHLLENVLFTEKYRPKRIEDCILPATQKARFSTIVQKGDLNTNLLLSGPPGTGKTTVARAMLEQMGVDYIVVNGSMNGNIDTLRNEIKQFASTVSMFEGGRKAVILDEADYLNMNSTQPALRNFMEEFSANCGFILTCNFPNRIIEPLQSRCTLIDFSIPAGERNTLLKDAIQRIVMILNTEGIEYDLRVIAEVVKLGFPDLRKIINRIQSYSNVGKIDTGILAAHSNLKSIVPVLKTKKFQDMRTWVAQNSDMDFNLFVSELYETLPESIAVEKLPYLVLILNKYDYQNSFVGNKEVNIAAMLLEIMTDVMT